MHTQNATQMHMYLQNIIDTKSWRPIVNWEVATWLKTVSVNGQNCIKYQE